MSEPGRTVLVSSAGRRVELVRFFQRALADLRLGGRVIATDANIAWSAAARVADAAVLSPRVGAPGYDRFLLDLVRREGVGLLVPTIDTELLQLAALAQPLRRAGCELVLSDLALVEICRDKRRTAEWFRGLGLETPAVYDRARLSFPCFVKPYDGSASIGARAVRSPGELSPDLLADDRMLFLELFARPEFDEFTVDAYYDRGGDLKCLVPRKRVEVRAGEISKGVALKGRTYEHLWRRLGHVAGARGCLTFQFFVSKDERRWVASELNPRFGGGYPLSWHAGADFPEWLLREYWLGEGIPVFEGWKDRTAMTRYDEEVIFTASDGA